MNSTTAPELHVPWQEVSKRAKQIAKTIEEKVRKATGEAALDDASDESPPLRGEPSHN